MTAGASTAALPVPTGWTAGAPSTRRRCLAGMTDQTLVRWGCRYERPRPRTNDRRPPPPSPQAPPSSFRRRPESRATTTSLPGQPTTPHATPPCRIHLPHWVPACAGTTLTGTPSPVTGSFRWPAGTTGTCTATAAHHHRPLRPHDRHSGTGAEPETPTTTEAPRPGQPTTPGHANPVPIHPPHYCPAGMTDRAPRVPPPTTTGLARPVSHGRAYPTPPCPSALGIAPAFAGTTGWGAGAVAVPVRRGLVQRWCTTAAHHHRPRKPHLLVIPAEGRTRPTPTVANTPRAVPARPVPSSRRTGFRPSPDDGLTAGACTNAASPTAARRKPLPFVISAKAGIQNPRLLFQLTPERRCTSGALITRRTGYRPAPVRRAGRWSPHQRGQPTAPTASPHPPSFRRRPNPEPIATIPTHAPSAAASGAHKTRRTGYRPAPVQGWGAGMGSWVWGCPPRERLACPKQAVMVLCR